MLLFLLVPMEYHDIKPKLPRLLYGFWLNISLDRVVLFLPRCLIPNLAVKHGHFGNFAVILNLLQKTQNSRPLALVFHIPEPFCLGRTPDCPPLGRRAAHEPSLRLSLPLYFRYGIQIPSYFLRLKHDSLMQDGFSFHSKPLKKNLYKAHWPSHNHPSTKQ